MMNLFKTLDTISDEALLICLVAVFVVLKLIDKIYTND